MKTELLKKANELNIIVVGKENSIVMKDVLRLSRELHISGFEVLRLIGEINNL